MRAQCKSTSGAVPSKARAPSNTDVQSHAACVRTPMIGTLPSCQAFSKKVRVFDQVTGRLIELSFHELPLSHGRSFVTMTAARRQEHEDLRI